MNVDAFETLLEKCDSQCSIDDKTGYVVFRPLSYKAKQTVDKILKDNQWNQLSKEAFIELYKKHYPFLKARREIKEKKIKEFFTMSPKEVANLPVEAKLDYMEMLFPLNQTIGETEAACKGNEKNIKTCLFNMDFPSSFWDKEKKSAERYVNLISKQPELIEKIKHWEKTTQEEKKAVIYQAAEIFEYVYGVKLNIAFFTQEEERAKNRENGLPEDTHIYGAYKHGDTIYFNEERLQSGDNFWGISVLFHESTHWRQEVETFEDPIVERLMNCNPNFVTTYEKKLGNKTEYEDFYTIDPSERHAYGLQEYVEGLLTEKTGVEQTQDVTLDEETKRMHNKAFSMARLTQYRAAK